ncbi:MAG: NUDIX hydrolase [Candidatus Accumulibacter sp.]|nr:NUDIX hydrolase [Accumulibacter sp.]
MDSVATAANHDENHLVETTIESSRVFKGRLLDVRLDRVRLPDASETTREYVRHQGAVVVIPVLDGGKLVFERQFRYPIGRVMIEFPAGKIDPGELAENAAKRELLEETGFVAGQWRRLGVLHPCVGYSDERIEIFLARELERRGGQNLDQGEFIDLMELTPEEAAAAVRDGEITDAKTIGALFWAEKVNSSRW